MKKLLIVVLLFVFVGGFAACGGGEANSTESLDTQTSQQAETEETVVEETMPTADPNAAVDALIGSWVDISDETRFANITKADTDYQYEDNEGQYPATFENGSLKIKASDTDTAESFIDAKTGNMLMIYQGSIWEFKKK